MIERLERVGKTADRHSVYRFRCECGSEFFGRVRQGNRQKYCPNCSWAISSKASAVLKHGHAVDGKPTKTYSAWSSMLSRCLNKNHSAYHNYGGRGITVCDDWRECFSNFLLDMGVAPPGLSLDRKDNDKGYFKDNCRWATPKQQAENRRSDGAWPRQ